MAHTRQSEDSCLLDSWISPKVNIRLKQGHQDLFTETERDAGRDALSFGDCELQGPYESGKAAAHLPFHMEKALQCTRPTQMRAERRERKGRRDNVSCVDTGYSCLKINL